jgi:DUF177 domain-containing protein
MRTDSPLVLDVRELLETHNAPRAIAFDAPVPELRSGLVEVPGDVHFDLVLEVIDGGVFVKGAVSGDASGQCRRCLKPVTQPFSLEGAELYRPAGDVWEEGYAIKDSTVDLEPFARDLIALSLPTDPLCRDDCAGLCSRCGSDLNDGECGCPEEIDPRWSALRELGGLTPRRGSVEGLPPQRGGVGGLPPQNE